MFYYKSQEYALVRKYPNQNAKNEITWRNGPKKYKESDYKPFHV